MANGREKYGVVNPEWNTEQIVLKDLSLKSDLPVVAKIIKGQFHHLGVSKIPLRKLHQEVFVHSIKTSVKVLAHSVQRYETKDGQCRIIPLEQRLSIPLTYQGWFEILSEDGRSSRPIDSVQRLAKELPNKCLVRQNVKGFVANSEGKLTYDSSNVIPAGEQLILSGEITTTTSSGERLKFLKCTDSRNNTLFLGFDQRGLFTPIAGPNDVAGVFTLKDIMQRFRLPLTVKLVQGVWPKVDKSRFSGLIRLDWAYTDETAFVCPTDKGNIRITPVPTEINFKLLTAKNMSDIAASVPCQDMLTKCSKMVANYYNTIHLIISVPDSVMKNRTHAFANILSLDPQPVPTKNDNRLKRASSREDILNDQLDDLYQYLREGRPPPKNKFTYESDEESYYEEPAYEPLDDFRSRLAMLDKGKPGFNNNSKYRPTTMYDRPKGGSPTYVRIEQTISPHKAQMDDSPPPVPPPRRPFNRTESAPNIKNPRPADSSSGSGSREMHRVVSDATLQKRSKHKDKYKPKQQPQQQDDARSTRTGSSGNRRHSLNTLYL